MYLLKFGMPTHDCDIDPIYCVVHSVHLIVCRRIFGTAYNDGQCL